MGPAQDYFKFAFPYPSCRIVFVDAAPRPLVASVPSLLLLDADLLSGPNECERPLALRRYATAAQRRRLASALCLTRGQSPQNCACPARRASFVALALATQWFGACLYPKSAADAWLLIGLAGYVARVFLHSVLGWTDIRYGIVVRPSADTRLRRRC